MVKDIMAANEDVRANDREMAALREHFPACFAADGSFDIARFKEYLADKVNVTNEGYELRFLGKNYARLLASVDTTTVIVPDEEHNQKPENANSENIYISGDNLDGLKHLLKSYARKVKCIYIDPPYNTGSDGFVYNDSFHFTAEDLEEKLSIDESQAARILDLTKRGSASHSAWLMFMYPRLLLARDLLTDDGVIFISIDDNEQANLKLLCDDVFGEENFVVSIVWEKRYTRSNNAKKFTTLTESVLCYARNAEFITTIKEIRNEKADSIYSNPDNDPRGEWTSVSYVNPASREQRPNLVYPIINPFTNEEVIHPTNAWKFEKKVYEAHVRENKLYWGKNKENKYPRLKKFLAEMDGGMVPVDLWRQEDTGTTDQASKEVENLFEKKVFDFPKPKELIMRMASLIINDSMGKDDIILDFFSGSSTTAHAVAQLNAEDGGHRRFIMVQIQEPTKEKSEARNAGYQTIDEIGMERIIRAAKKIREENPDTSADLGFRHFTLKEPSAKTLDKLETFESEDGLMIQNTVLADFGVPTILATWLVRDGYGFAAPVETVDFAGYTGYHMDKHLYLIAPELSDEAIGAIVERYETDGAFNPENVVLFGYSFLWTEMESLKANLARLKATEKNLHIHFDIRY